MKEAADAGRTDYSHYDALAVAIGEHKGRALVQEVEARTATLNVGAFENAVAKNQFVAKAELGSEPGGDAAYFTLTSSTSLSQPLAIGSNQALYEKAGASVKALWDAVNSPSTTEEERLANLKTLVEQLGQNGAKKFTIAGQTFDIVKKENGTHTLEWTYLDQAANTQQRYTLNDLDVANANGAGLFATLTAMNNPQRNLPGRNLPAMTIEFESGAVLDTANVVTTEQLSQTQSVLAALRAEPGDAAAQSIIRNNAFLSESGILTSNPLLKAITPTAIPATTPAAEQGAAQGSDAPEQVKPSEALFNYENGGAELLYSIPISTSEDLERFIASNSGKIEISDLFVLYNRNGISEIGRAHV